MIATTSVVQMMLMRRDIKVLPFFEGVRRCHDWPRGRGVGRSSVGPYDRVNQPRRKTGLIGKNSGIHQVVARLTRFRTQLAPLASLEGVLPLLLRHLSLGRAQIAIDHIRGAIEAKTSDRIVLVTLCDADKAETRWPQRLRFNNPTPIQIPPATWRRSSMLVC